MQFGPDVTKRFCENNGLEAIIRSHEVRMEGYEEEHGGKCITGMARLLILCSSTLTVEKFSLLPSTAIVRKIKGHISILARITSLNSTSLMPSHIPISDLW